MDARPPNLQLEEELRDTQKKGSLVENELDKTQEELATTKNKLEESDKKVQEVSGTAI